MLLLNADGSRIRVHPGPWKACLDSHPTRHGAISYISISISDDVCINESSSSLHIQIQATEGRHFVSSESADQSNILPPPRPPQSYIYSGVVAV
jgi:hypothetical protein